MDNEPKSPEIPEHTFNKRIEMLLHRAVVDKEFAKVLLSKDLIDLAFQIAKEGRKTKMTGDVVYQPISFTEDERKAIKNVTNEAKTLKQFAGALTVENPQPTKFPPPKVD